jgi:glycosyltransferase involved in cell wall biosynthesis
MRIGFDAKRAFYNRSGLGNYSRDTIRALHYNFRMHEYYLYTPGLRNSLNWIHHNDFHLCLPSQFYGAFAKAYWRTFRLSDQLKSDNIEIYHGLSNELPQGIEKSGIKSVVTIHDLIFMRHPEWYKPIDRIIYRKKFLHSSRMADRVVTVSKQTKDDLIRFFGIEESKVQVIYQGCNEVFKKVHLKEEKQAIRQKWNLPEEYILYVGTVEERKNLLTLVKAIKESQIDMPIVVIGRQKSYAKKVHAYIRENKLSQILFMNEVPVNDLPGIYQMANVFVYPSLFEGFGIPVLEALYSGVPVITSGGGCFNEVGGDNSIYIDPTNADELGHALKQILFDSRMSDKIRNAGYLHAKKFSGENSAQELMDLYKQLANG